MPTRVAVDDDEQQIQDLIKEMRRLRSRLSTTSVKGTHDEFTAAATPSTTYTLTYIPVTGTCLMALNGHVQREGTDYTCDYDTGIVTVSATQASGDKITFRYLVTDWLIARSLPADEGIVGLWAWGGWTTNHMYRYDISAGTWSILNAYPDWPAAANTGTFAYGSDLVNGRFYGASGSASGGDVTTNYYYDTAAGTWTSRAAIPTAVDGCGGCWYNGKLYVFGGFSNALGATQATTQIYDPGTNTWSSGAAMPTAVGSNPVCAAWGTKIYVVGGTLTGTTWTGHTMIYDVAGNSWTTGANESTGMAYSAGGMINGKLYVCSGQQSGFGYVATSLAYDVAGNSWSAIASMPAVRANAAAVAANGSLYVHGGSATGGSPGTANLYRYDPASNAWTTLTSGPQSMYNHGLGANIG